MTLKNKNKINNMKFENNMEFKMINGQKTGIIPNLQYGFFSMGRNGCEIISVYNALIYCKTPVPISEIAFIMEKYRLLFGLLGCNPFCFDKLNTVLGLNAIKIRNPKNTPAFIISFWCGIPFISSVHTVFCTAEENNHITVYNRYNQSKGATTYNNFDDFIGNRKIISAYAIKKQIFCFN